MQSLVNHIYWSMNNFMTNGTHLKIFSDLSVNFRNQLMAPGKEIIRWESINNYQGTKLVPQLPILQVNHQYRINVGIESVPDQTYLIRLSFKNLQGTEIKREDFRSPSHKFVFPAGTTSYSITIFNNGMASFHFKRIDICDSNLPESINKPIWAQTPLNWEAGNQQALNIILVRDGKQARKTFPALKKLVGLVPVQVVNIDWKYQQGLADKLLQKLDNSELTNYRLISADFSLDDVLLEIKQKRPQAEVMLADSQKTAQNGGASWTLVPVPWYSPNVVDPDWVSIIAAIKQTWGE